MFQRVLLTTDGSALSRAAIPHALRVIDRRDGEVHIIEVKREDELLDAAATRRGAAGGGGVSETKFGGPDEHVRQIRTALRSAGFANVELAVFAGDPGPTIVLHARAIGAEAVVMATHGRSGLSRTLFGSVADHVLRELTQVPVLLVRPGEEDARLFSGDRWFTSWADRLHQLKPYRSVLVPTDGSDFSMAVLPTVARALDPSVAQVDLVTVIDRLPQPIGDGPQSAAEQAAQAEYQRASAQLAIARARLEERGIGVIAAVRDGSPVEDVLAGFARRRGVELVAMATHGRSGVARGILGSVPAYLLRHLPGVPLLLQRHAADEPAPPGSGPA